MGVEVDAIAHERDALVLQSRPLGQEAGCEPPVAVHDAMTWHPSVVAGRKGPPDFTSAAGATEQQRNAAVCGHPTARDASDDGIRAVGETHRAQASAELARDLAETERFGPDQTLQRAFGPARSLPARCRPRRAVGFGSASLEDRHALRGCTARAGSRLARGLRRHQGMPVVIVSVVFALYGDLRALAIGYTDEAALARAAVIFVASLVVLRLLGSLFRTWRLRRRSAGIDQSVVAPASSEPPAYPPRREYLRDGAGRKDRAA